MGGRIGLRTLGQIPEPFIHLKTPIERRTTTYYGRDRRKDHRGQTLTRVKESDEGSFNQVMVIAAVDRPLFGPTSNERS